MSTEGSAVQDGGSTLSVADLIASFDRSEVWRPVLGWPGYEVSSWGDVRRFGKRLKPASISRYPYVSLSRNGRRQTTRIHHLVALAFLGSPPFEDAIVAHNDGVPSNTRASNLRWASARENQSDRVRHNTRCRGSKVFGAKLSEEQIPVIRQRIAAGERYQDIGDDFGVSIHTICLIKKNRIWKHAHGAAWPVSANTESRA